MPAITPKQITILNALKTQLEAINGTGSYNTIVKTVTRRWTNALKSDLQNRPLIVIQPISSRFTFKLGNRKTTGNSRFDPDDGWLVELHCHIRPQTDSENESLLQDALIKFYADIEMCIDSGLTISNNVIETRLIEEAMEFDYNNSKGTLYLLLSIKYDFDPGVDP